MIGKGSTRRPGNDAKYRDGWERIFSKEKEREIEEWVHEKFKAMDKGSKRAARSKQTYGTTEESSDVCVKQNASDNTQTALPMVDETQKCTHFRESGVCAHYGHGLVCGHRNNPAACSDYKPEEQ